MTLSLADVLNGSSLPNFLSIQAGFVPGSQIRNRFAIAALSTTQETMWSLLGLYNYQAVPSQFYISSDNAADVGNVFRLELLDADYGQIFIDAILDGQNGVQIGSVQYIRGNCMRNVSPGNNKTVGDVYVGVEPIPAGGVPAFANTVMHAPSERQRCSSTVYTVPKGKVGFVFQAHGAASKGREAVYDFAVTPFGQTQVAEIGTTLFESTVRAEFPFHRADEKTDIEIKGVVDLPGAETSAGYDILLLNKNVVRTPTRPPITVP